MLKDLQEKLEHSLICFKSKTFPSSSRAAISSTPRLDRMEPGDVAARTVRLLDHLLDNLDVVTSYHKNLMEVNDGVLDAPGMFNAQTASILECQERIFNCLRALFSWESFRDSGKKDTRPLLREALCSLGRRSGLDVSLTSSGLPALAGAAFDHLAATADAVMHAGGAEALIRLLEALLFFVDEDGEGRGRSRKVLRITKMFLARDWRDANGDKAKGAKYAAKLLPTVLPIMF